MLVIAAPLKTGDGLAAERFERSEALERLKRLERFPSDC